MTGRPRPSRGRIAVPLWDYYADEGLPEETLELAPFGLLGLDALPFARGSAESVREQRVQPLP